MADGGEDTLAQLALALRTLRLRRRLQMGGLQQRTGLGRTTISQALSGSKVPSEATVVALAEALGTDAEPLLALRAQASPTRARPAAASGGTRPGRQDFAGRYLDYVAERHARLTVVGLDLSGPERACWPLDAAYLSLELAGQDEDQERGHRPAVSPGAVCRAEQALAGHRRILLRGLAGSGKTTLLQWLAVSTARGGLPPELSQYRGHIPFVLPLRTLVRQGRLPQPHEFLLAAEAPLAEGQPAGWADTTLAAGRGLILVDGVDEVPQEHRQAAREWLTSLAAAYRDAAFVVTTRPSAVPDGWLGGLDFTELTVRPMGVADTGRFIGRWFASAKATASSDAERALLDSLKESLLTTLRVQREVAQLSTTPLLCSLICALHRDRRGHLPHSRMELYEAALSMLMVRRDRERSITEPEGVRLGEHQTLHLLQHLAYWLIRNQQSEMSYTTARKLVTDLLPTMPALADQNGPDEILTHLIARSGLLRQPTADTVDFVHRTFQDYLGARAAVEAADLPLLINHAHDTQWEDVVRMAIAHARPTERAQLLNDLIDRGDQEGKHRTRLHLLAATSLPYATEVAPDTRRKVTARAAALMPPRSIREADTLSALGPGILDLMPPAADGLDANEIWAVTRTATTVGGDQAYAYLQRFVPTIDDSAPVGELGLGWSNFEAADYARDILRPVRDRLYLTVRTRAQFEALPLLTPLKRVAFNTAVTQDEITEHLSPQHTDSLQLMEGPSLRSLSFVRSLAALRNLALGPSVPVDSLRDLAGLPLPQLSLLDVPDGFSFGALSQLPQLRELSLYTVLPWRTLKDLPAPPNLTKLWLGGRIEASVTGITQWAALEDVVVNHVMDAVEWAELASLPQLTQLHVTDADLTVTPVMPPVSCLRLSLTRSDVRLDLVPERFPNLEQLSITALADISCDLTPLRALTNVQISVYNADRIALTGLDNLAPSRLVLSPRPR
ncbi:NACHT domain-containing protein [Streptomyces mirabilis]|uniref:NACHT domain-containing protein n=1 Tax=Streptomyces mirabilis TaxID=68239 RepID=UPI00225859A1|nr:NACHT domain-containing protein [Streptomyces mirabilis]MCX4429609.1 NACHT domain-containing protein [Streptomyces mirabilis]